MLGLAATVVPQNARARSPCSPVIGGKGRPRRSCIGSTAPESRKQWRQVPRGAQAAARVGEANSTEIFLLAVLLQDKRGPVIGAWVDAAGEVLPLAVSGL